MASALNLPSFHDSGLPDAGRVFPHRLKLGPPREGSETPGHRGNLLVCLPSAIPTGEIGLPWKNLGSLLGLPSGAGVGRCKHPRNPNVDGPSTARGGSVCDLEAAVLLFAAQPRFLAGPS